MTAFVTRLVISSEFMFISKGKCAPNYEGAVFELSCLRPISGTANLSNYLGRFPEMVFNDRHPEWIFGSAGWTVQTNERPHIVALVIAGFAMECYLGSQRKPE